MNLKATLLCLGLILGAFLQPAFGQNITATGKVLNRSTGNPLEGVTVKEQGKSNVTTTDASGTFSISVAKGAKLSFTFVGMSPVTVQFNKVGDQTVMMDEATTNLDEVVVIGYGTQKVTKVSGAISSVKGTDVQKLKPVRIDDAIQGASGVNVIQSGSPGGAPTIIIRGIPSYGGNSPLIVVDGVPQTQGDLNSINPADIESINILKDAATAAIYGVKSGNGVVIVTTKTGRKNQKTEFNLSSTYGFQEVVRTVPVLNASEYGAIINEGSTLSGGDVIFNDLSKLGVGTNWQDEVFKKAPIQTHSLTARGGSDKVTYFLSGGYLSQGGIVGGIDKSRFDRINFGTNLTFDLSSKLKFILNANYVNLSSKGVQENSFNSIIGSALNFDPTVPVYNNVPNTVGQYGFSSRLLSEVFNPLTKLENTYNKNIGNKFFGKFELQYDVLKNLKLTTRYGYTKYNGNAKTFTPSVFYGINNVDNSLDELGNPVIGRHNSVAQQKSTNNTFTYELFGTYNFKLAKNHHFETVAGFSLAEVSGNAAGASRQDVPFNSWEFADYTSATGNNSATNLNANTGFYYQYRSRNASLFGRINYDYNDKYLVSVTARRDGSTAFGKDNKWAFFPSGSLGWVVSKENFFKSRFIDFLKIRGSYGSLGNDNVSPTFRTIQTDYLASLYGSGNSIGYTFGSTFISGSTLGSLGNDELGWETQTQMNVGFDMNFYKNKFNISADYFQKKTKGLIYVPSISATLGTIPPPPANIGSTKSSGVDITLGYKDRIGKNLKVSTSVTFTSVKNSVTATNNEGTARLVGGGYFNGQSQTVSVFEKDQSPWYYYGYRTDGLFQSAAEIAASATQTGAQPGDIKFVDLNGDGVIDSKDQTQIGNPFPKFTIGWNLNLEYKNFDLSVLTYASSGNDVYNAMERNANNTNKFRSVLSRWTGPSTTNDARSPRYSFVDANNNSRVSDRYVYDGSFIKIRNIVLGYNLAFKPVMKVFKAVRIYGQVKNAFTFTKYEGFDPEISGGLDNIGIDRGAYPLARSYSVGLDLKF
ncbi:MAG: TonB-dependent receptor [Chitinophagaceae bacterium]|nr:TonB-dependent receptor [Chitinophagaceae bacterium]